MVTYRYSNFGKNDIKTNIIFPGVILLRCPNCKSKNIGKLGNQHYYCWDCYIELTLADRILHMNEVEEDGSLSSLDDLFTEEDRRIQG